MVRPQLGSSLPAYALPLAHDGQPEHVLLFFGIIDFLQVRLCACHMHAQAAACRCMVI